MPSPFHWLLDRPIVYVDCGARGDRTKSLLKGFPHARCIGFEPDEEECARLRADARPGYSFFAVAAGARRERRALHVTRNPACSSLLQPNHELLARYLDLGDYFEVTATTAVDVVALDEFLPQQDLHQLDILELDVQGAELEVLEGARALLHTSTLAVLCEVEFAPMYVAQPLFGDIDAFLRKCGFVLFDLDRYHVRRAGWPEAPTRGQLLWGQTVYLKDHRLVDEAGRREMLAAIAFLLGFNDYSAEILDSLAAAPEVEPTRQTLLTRTRRTLRRTAERGLPGTLVRLDRSALGRPLQAVARRCQTVADAYAAATRRRRYVWRD